MAAFLQNLVLACLTVAVGGQLDGLLTSGGRSDINSFPGYIPASLCTQLLLNKCPSLKEIIPSPSAEFKRALPNVFLTIEELKSTLGENTKVHFPLEQAVFADRMFDLREPPMSAALASPNSGATGIPNFGFQNVSPDICCGTTEVFFVNETLTDVTGEKRKILQLADIGAYQFIRHGLCASKGACQGTCVQHYIYMPLAVDESSKTSAGSFTFRFFKLPGYCSCRAIG